MDGRRTERRKAPGNRIRLTGQLVRPKPVSCMDARKPLLRGTLRWCAAGMVEAGKQFRKVNGHLHLRTLRDTLNKVTEPIGATSHDETVNAA